MNNAKGCLTALTILFFCLIGYLFILGPILDPNPAWLEKVLAPIGYILESAFDGFLLLCVLPFLAIILAIGWLLHHLFK